MNILIKKILPVFLLLIALCQTQIVYSQDSEPQDEELSEEVANEAADENVVTEHVSPKPEYPFGIHFFEVLEEPMLKEMNPKPKDPGPAPIEDGVLYLFGLGVLYSLCRGFRWKKTN